jgi:peptide/nickel transport system permease protein
MQKDYVRTTSAKGLRQDTILTRHVLKNSLLPTMTMFTMEFAKLLGGAVIIETVFAWPGVGKLVVDAVYARDFAIVQAAVVFFALIFVVSNFLVDFLYTYVDPRIKYS